MASSTFIYNSFREFIGDGSIDLNSNTFKLTLHTSAYVPNLLSDSVFAHATHELPTANGYVSGGVTLSGATWTRVGGTVTFDANDIFITASAAGLTARYGVISATGTLNGRVDPLVCYILLDNTPVDIIVASGILLSVIFSPSGIFTLT